MYTITANRRVLYQSFDRELAHAVYEFYSALYCWSTRVRMRKVWR